MGSSPVVRSTTSSLLQRSHRHVLATTAHRDRTRGEQPAYRFRPMRREADLIRQEQALAAAGV